MNDSIEAGKIELIMGPMFSGKTSALMSKIKREKYSKKKCFLVKYSADLRYSTDSVCSHNMTTMEAKSVTLLGDLDKADLESHDVIGIDEGQFFQDLVQFCEHYVRLGKHIIISALDTDSERNPWTVIKNLFPICLKIKKLNARCKICGLKAGWTYKYNHTETVVDSSVNRIEIGGEELYIAVCLFHYENLIKHRNDSLF